MRMMVMMFAASLGLKYPNGNLDFLWSRRARGRVLSRAEGSACEGL